MSEIISGKISGRMAERMAEIILQLKKIIIIM